MSTVSFAVLYLAWCCIAALMPSAEARDVNGEILSAIERHMDISVDPCDDFHSYACGNWEQQHLLKDYQETIGLVDYKTDLHFARILKKLLRKQEGSENPHFIRNLLTYYQVCRHVTEYQPLQYFTLLNEMEAIKWPSLEDVGRRRTHLTHRGGSPDTSYDWLRTLAVLRKYGMNGILLELTIIQRKENATESIIDLDKPVLDGGFQPLTRQQLLLMLDYLVVGQLRRANKWAEAIELFEYELLRLCEIEDDEGNREVTLSELELPQLLKYLHTFVGHSLPGNTKLSVQNLRYMRRLFRTLELYEPQTVCRYLMIRFLWHLFKSAPPNFRKLECVSHVRSMFPLAMSWLQQISTLPQDREIVGEVFSQLKEHFMATLEANANRLDPSLVSFLQSKLTTMQLRLGNLPQNNSVIAVFYADLHLNTSYSFYENHLLLLRHHTASQTKYFHRPRILDDTFFHLEDADTAASSSPYYLMRQNIVFLPLGLLQPPIYHRNLSSVFTYSAIGFLLAHEITHGFDESGIEFDRSGNMLGPAELIRSNRHFSRSLSCLRGRQPQYLDEKIADVNGFRVAYETYFDGNNAIRLHQSTSDLDLSEGQRKSFFFLNFAQFFCGTATRQELISGEHGRDSERVTRTLSNFAEFAEVFKCEPGSRMNPEKKCHLWR